MKVVLNGGYGSLMVLQGLMAILHQINHDIPSKLDPVFSLSGASSGSGLPIGVTLGLLPAGELTVRCTRPTPLHAPA